MIPGDNEIFLERYSRQMLIPQIGVDGQQLISSSSVVVIGAGGIGSTVLMYLAAAGIGKLHCIDFDTVEATNLHRQIIHSTHGLGQPKTESAEQRLRQLNDTIELSSSAVRLNADNALDLLRPFDVVIDATDNFTSRYLINDACVLLSKPLISGSAVGLEGQITVLSTPSGPCYRCLHPQPSFTESCRSCANAGVLGPVPGLIGCLQSIECMKILLASKSTEFNPSTQLQPLIGRQVFYDGLSGEFLTFKLPNKDPACAACGHSPSILSMDDSAANTDEALARNAALSALPDLPVSAIVDAKDYLDVVLTGAPHIVLDVRSTIQFQMVSFQRYIRDGEFLLPCKFETSTDLKLETDGNERGHAVAESHTVRADCRTGRITLLNIPLLKLLGDRFGQSADKAQLSELQALKEAICKATLNSQMLSSEMHSPLSVPSSKILSDASSSIQNTSEDNVQEFPTMPIYVICRRGIDSTTATRLLMDHGFLNVFNIEGGLNAWRTECDSDFPSY